MAADESGALVPSSIEASLATPTCASPGYYNGDTNNNLSYRFSLQNAASLTDTQRIAVRMTIPKATWGAYKQKAQDENLGDNLYIGALANIVGYGTDIYPLLIPYAHESTGWKFGAESLLSPRDGTWYNTSYRQSLSALDAGKEANGDVTLLFVLSATEFGTSNSIYLDNLSLGWAACSDFGTQNANGTYYYSDGTSMATPNTTGVVSLLSSHAKFKSGETNNQQSADTAKEIVSFIKGGVTSVDSLGNQCKTGGAVDAQVSYATYVEYQKASEPEGKLNATSALKPVPDSITDNGDGTLTLSGNFFGNTTGTVSFEGTNLTVTNWTDSSITFKSLSYDKETIGKVVVKKKNGEDTVSGQSYLVMPAAANSTATFSNLSNPNFEITYTETGSDGQMTTFTTNASEVTPLKMAAASGYVYVYGMAASSCVPVLMRYNIASKTWDTKNYLDGYSSQMLVNTTSRLSDSMVAGKSEIYLKVASKQGENFSILSTIQAETGTVSSSATIDKAQVNSAGTLGFYDGKLFLVGGKKGEPLCSVIYPDSAQVCWSASETLPINALYGTVTNNGSGLSITGSFNTETADLGSAYGYEAGQKNQEMDITFNADGSTTLKTSTSVFFPEADKSSEYGLDSGQGFSTIAVAGVDGGVLMTGPVKGNETANMIDTWLYTTSDQKWSEITATRFAPALEASACASTYDGIYYVMAQDTQGSNVFQKFGSYSLSALGLSDSNVTPTSDALKSSSVGDLNNDNKVNITDAQVVTDMIAGNWTETTSYDLLMEALKKRGTNWDAISLTAVADANGDKVVNAEDARAIQNRMHTGSFTSSEGTTTQASAASTSVASVTSRASMRVASASSVAATSSLASADVSSASSLASATSDTTTTPSYKATWASAPQVKSGEDFSITLSLNDSTGENAVAFSSVSINFDPTKVKLTSVSGADNIMTTSPTESTALTSFYGNTQTGATLTYNFTALPESSGSAGISFASGSAGAPVQLDSYDVISAKPDSKVTITYSPNTPSSYDKTGVQLPDEACVPILFGVALLLMVAMGAWLVYRKRKNDRVN